VPSQHKHNPIAYRPPQDVRDWLAAESARTGQAVNALITMLARERMARDGGTTAAGALVEGGATAASRKPRAAPAAAPSAKPEPESASDIMAALRRRRTGGQ
jgi:hypothetical protein